MNSPEELTRSVFNDCVIWKNEEGKIHRNDGPALEFDDGSNVWFKNGIIHRDDGPAFEKENVSKEYVVNGKIHRLDGPAMIYFDIKSRIFWIEGENVSSEYFEGVHIEKYWR